MTDPTMPMIPDHKAVFWPNGKLAMICPQENPARLGSHRAGSTYLVRPSLVGDDGLTEPERLLRRMILAYANCHYQVQSMEDAQNMTVADLVAGEAHTYLAETIRRV